MFGSQQELDPARVVNGKGRRYSRSTLQTVIWRTQIGAASCLMSIPGLQEHVLGYAVHIGCTRDFVYLDPSVKGANFAVSARRRNSSSKRLMVWLPLAWYCDSHHQRGHTRKSCPVSEAIKLAPPHTHGCSQTRSSCSSNLKSERHYQELLTLLTADLETNSTA